MNRAPLALLAACLITATACSKNSPSSQTVPVQPKPVTIAAEPAAEPPAFTPTPVAAAPRREIAEPLEPSPVPPTVDEAVDAPPVPPEDTTSAAEVMESVSRVLRGAVGADEDEPSQGSIFRSIGRALVKGAREAASAEDVAEEEGSE